MRWLHVLSVALLISVGVAQRGQSRPSPTSPPTAGDCDEVCETEVDIVFILDDSNSIADFQFDIMKDFVRDVIANDVQIGGDEGQVGIVQFDDDSHVRCDLEDSEAAVEDCLDDTVYTSGGLTNIEAALVDAMNIRNQRSGVAKVMVLFTDGDPTAGGDPVVAADEAKADGWEIYAIGIGNVSQDMLRRIATDDDHFFFVDDFEDLPDLDFSVCLPGDCPIIDPCAQECEAIVDVVFVLDDSNSIAEFEFDMMKEFVGGVVDELGVGDDAANIAIVQFDDNAETICDFEDSESAVRGCLDDTVFDLGGLTNIAEALENAKNVQDGRSGVSKVIVLMTDGQPTAGGDPKPVADMAKDDGWLLYTIGIGDADLSFLEDIATGPDYAFVADDFDDLLSGVASQFEICVGGSGSAGETCSSEIDLIFILDDSNSIAEWEFELMKEFVVAVADTLIIAPDQGQVGAVQFDDDASVQFDLDENDDSDGVVRSIGDVRYTDGGLTNIDAGFREALEVGGRRNGVPGVIVLMTDGDPTAGDPTVPFADVAKDEGFDVWCVGIGNVNVNLLEDLASSPDQVILADDFEALAGVLDQLVVCDPIPCDVPCEDVCESQVDVCFILDESNSLNSEQFDIMKLFIEEVANELGVGPDAANIGIVQFDDDAEVVCDIQSSAGAVASCLDDAQHVSGGLTNIKDAIDNCAGISGGRANVADVMVLMTDGEPTTGGSGGVSDRDAAIDAAENARGDGWEVFAIGIGNVEESTLNAIADDGNHVFMAEDFESLLEEVLEDFQICVPADDCGGLCGESDIVWITDHSASIGPDQFRQLLDFQVTVVESSPDEAHWGQVGFGDDGFTNFHLDACSNNACVVDEINSIDYQSGNTNLAAGIREGRDIEGGRPGVNKIFFLATDGEPNREEDQVLPEAQDAKQEGWEFICLGIANVDAAFLEQFCDTVYIVESFDQLAEFVQDILC